MSVKISTGNTKLGSIPNLNLPPGITCEKNIPCLKNGCYAMKAWTQYPATRMAWSSNLSEFQKDDQNFFVQIQNWFDRKKKPVQYFRWHSAGDIVSQRYLDGMFEIGRQNPTTNFLAFTKRFNFDYSKCPSNLNIVFSLWPGLTLPLWTGSYAWMEDGTDKRIISLNNTYICPGSCEKCKTCWTKQYKNIIFNKH